MSHTPTPWKVHDDGDNAPFITGAASDVHRVCDLYNWEYMNRPEEAKDNAVHIVRCVNAHEKLVEALTFLLNETEDYIRINNLSAHHNHSLEMARAALAAAKGT